MPTKRLTDYDKSLLNSSVAGILQRLNRAADCPLVVEEIPGLLVASTPYAVREAVKLLEEECSTALQRHWTSSFHVADEENAYRVQSHYTAYAMDSARRLPPEHPKHDVILKWCKEQLANERMGLEARLDFESIVSACSSAGQLTTVLPFIVRFLPKKARQSLGGIERKSRWPKGLKLTKENIEQIHNALAIGSLLEDKPSAVFHAYLG